MARYILTYGIVGDHDGAYDEVRKIDYYNHNFNLGFHKANWPSESYLVIETVESSSIPCARCKGPVIEFSIPNDIWNKVIRHGGPEQDNEYICWDCFWKELREILFARTPITIKKGF